MGENVGGIYKCSSVGGEDEKSTSNVKNNHEACSSRKKKYKCKEIINVLVKCAFSASVCCYDILNLNSPRVWNNLV